MKIARYLSTLVLAAAMLALPASSHAGVFVGISVGIAPPPLPVYEQPVIPGPGYLWTPGYWAWSDDGYYWVPGTWVVPPTVGFLWTPGYWGWGNGTYLFHAGYWGPHIGFYGGVNYGYGYGGVGYEGGYWNHGVFAYNRSVNNISNVHITNVYNHTVVNNVTVNRTSFNGGAGGIQAQPTGQEQTAFRENHMQATSEQERHINQAQANPQLRASENGGRPAIAATSRPGDFHSAVPARAAGGQVNTETYRAAAANGGKLPQGMRDPGGNNPVNRSANTAAVRGENSRGENANPSRPANESASRPESPATRPETQTARPAEQSGPPSGARPVQPNYRSQMNESSQPRTSYESRPQSEPAHASQPTHQSQQTNQPKPQASHSQHENESHEGKPK